MYVLNPFRGTRSLEPRAAPSLVDVGSYMPIAGKRLKDQILGTLRFAGRYKAQIVWIYTNHWIRKFMDWVDGSGVIGFSKAGSKCEAYLDGKLLLIIMVSQIESSRIAQNETEL